MIRKYVEAKQGDSPGITTYEEEEEKERVAERRPKEEAQFDGFLDYETYSRLVEENPSILRWFTIDLHKVEHWAKFLKK